MQKILKNKIRCNKCGAVAIDGGLDYLRRCGDLKGFTELREYDSESL